MSQYMKISSDFGLVQYMDSHILYSEDGEGGLPQQVRKRNIGHQVGVAGLLTVGRQFFTVNEYLNLSDS